MSGKKVWTPLLRGRLTHFIFYYFVIFHIHFINIKSIKQLIHH